MRVATWNVNGLRARLDFLLHWLRERKPDVVGLQELKLSDEQFPHDAFAAEGYSAVTHGQKSWNGVAILAREPLEVVQRGLPGQEDQGARLLSARVRDLELTTIYCPNGKHTGHDDFPRKLAWLDALAEHLAARRTASARASTSSCTGCASASPTRWASRSSSSPTSSFRTTPSRPRATPR